MLTLRIIIIILFISFKRRLVFCFGAMLELIFRMLCSVRGGIRELFRFMMLFCCFVISGVSGLEIRVFKIILVGNFTAILTFLELNSSYFSYSNTYLPYFCLPSIFPKNSFSQYPNIPISDNAS